MYLKVKDLPDALQRVLVTVGYAKQGVELEANLNSVVVVEGKDGKHYIGEFGFSFRKVSKKVALHAAQIFGDEE